MNPNILNRFETPDVMSESVKAVANYQEAVPLEANEVSSLEDELKEIGQQNDLLAALSNALYDLNDTLFIDEEGVICTTCTSCGEDMPIHCHPEEFDQRSAYCGGTPHCIP